MRKIFVISFLIFIFAVSANADIFGPTQSAQDIDITDTGSYYTGTNVETALQEIGAGGIGSTFTAGSVIFSDGTTLAQDNSNLFWDNTNKNFGIGTTTNLARLTAKGRATFNATGTVSTTIGSMAVTGVGTLFTTELAIGDRVVIGSEHRTVATITDATNITVGGNSYTVANSGATMAVYSSLFRLDDSAGNYKYIINDLGEIMIGDIVTPNRYQWYVKKDTTDAGSSGHNLMYFDGIAATTVDGTNYNRAIFGRITTNITAGTTNSGYISGLWFQTMREVSTDAGTLYRMFGIEVPYGHRGTALSASAITTEAYGIDITPYFTRGTITTMYDLHIDTGSSGGTVGDHWGVYQKATDIKNYFGSSVGIGVTAPTAVLHLKASTATADTASLKIDKGTVATTPITGNIESDGTHLYWTDSSGTRRQLDN